VVIRKRLVEYDTLSWGIGQHQEANFAIAVQIFTGRGTGQDDMQLAPQFNRIQQRRGEGVRPNQRVDISAKLGARRESGDQRPDDV
jgi:hypothetical protein